MIRHLLLITNHPILLLHNILHLSVVALWPATGNQTQDGRLQSLECTALASCCYQLGLVVEVKLEGQVDTVVLAWQVVRERSQAASEEAIIFNNCTF